MNTKLIMITLAAVLVLPAAAPAQILQGGGLGSRLERLQQKMTNKNTSIHYDPAVLTPGVPRAQVLAAFGPPNATQGEGIAREDIYAFYPDGSKFIDPQVGPGTIAAAVFTSGMSLVVRQARIVIEENKLTLYRVHYDALDDVKSVRVVPPKSGAATPVPTSAADSPPQ